MPNPDYSTLITLLFGIALLGFVWLGEIDQPGY